MHEVVADLALLRLDRLRLQVVGAIVMPTLPLGVARVALDDGVDRLAAQGHSQKGSGIQKRQKFIPKHRLFALEQMLQIN
jgi:hypothetical protein